MQNVEAECRGLAEVIARIGDKWTVMVCGHLSEGTHRFNALKHRIPGISHRMLTITLRGLERDGLVARKAYATVPPKVEYCLTPLGQSLTGPLAALASWARENRPALEQARAAFDRRAAQD
ncbi:MAG: helix-turn-helix transcriptional regulator [Acetobacter sp.]|jgi:DNA-binding HxlR family transcriptional regulator|nr:helix-turn-helix transcriptional regulator [Acetobacter sp.]MCH4060631.1 helix-turn-helix transcriptional regulator [Acetobacter sp.]MCH4087571.1 helix-turn-helix transcriptional regulator [Acetobacter sp.]